MDVSMRLASSILERRYKYNVYKVYVYMKKFPELRL